jgi:myo-inositol 2-dehydrogenase/D-chiro-inositol 1-dehydrogenase
MNVRVGVIGAGIMGSDHARTLATSVKGAAVTAVSDTDRHRASAIASETGAYRVHTDAQALIADPDVDAVLVASPDGTHADLVLACLDAGKPVLCEKPLAPDIDSCLRVIAAETALGRRLVQVGFMRRFDPGYAAMQGSASSRDFGSPLLMQCVHRNASVPPSFDSGMVITNSAVHEIDIARWLLRDEFTSVTVFSRSSSTSGSAERPQLIVLESRSGVLVEIEVFVSARYGYDVRAELVCEAGTLSLAPHASICTRSSGQNASRFAGDWRAHFEAAYRLQLQAWIASVSTGVAVGASAWDGYVATATAAACIEALQSRITTGVRIEPRPDLYG